MFLIWFRPRFCRLFLCRAPFSLFPSEVESDRKQTWNFSKVPVSIFVPVSCSFFFLFFVAYARGMSPPWFPLMFSFFFLHPSCFVGSRIGTESRLETSGKFQVQFWFWFQFQFRLDPALPVLQGSFGERLASVSLTYLSSKEKVGKTFQMSCRLPGVPSSLNVSHWDPIGIRLSRSP